MKKLFCLVVIALSFGISLAQFNIISYKEYSFASLDRHGITQESTRHERDDDGYWQRIEDWVYEGTTPGGLDYVDKVSLYQQGIVSPNQLWFATSTMALNGQFRGGERSPRAFSNAGTAVYAVSFSVTSPTLVHIRVDVSCDSIWEGLAAAWPFVGVTLIERGGGLQKEIFSLRASGDVFDDQVMLLPGKTYNLAYIMSTRVSIGLNAEGYANASAVAVGSVTPL